MSCTASSVSSRSSSSRFTSSPCSSTRSLGSASSRSSHRSPPTTDLCGWAWASSPSTCCSPCGSVRNCARTLGFVRGGPSIAFVRRLRRGYRPWARYWKRHAHGLGIRSLRCKRPRRRRPRRSPAACPDVSRAATPPSASGRWIARRPRRRDLERERPLSGTLGRTGGRRSGQPRSCFDWSRRGSSCLVCGVLPPGACQFLRAAFAGCVTVNCLSTPAVVRQFELTGHSAEGARDHAEILPSRHSAPTRWRRDGTRAALPWRRDTHVPG